MIKYKDQWWLNSTIEVATVSLRLMFVQLVIHTRMLVCVDTKMFYFGEWVQDHVRGQ